MSKIAYEPHPVSPERKAELVSQGYKIIDAAFAPADHAEPAAEAEAPKPRRGKAKEAEA